MKTKIHLLWIAVILTIVFIPYVLGYLLQGNLIFSGLLFNPQDGYSYLAKMRQGWEGSWQFTLPYTVSPGKPVPLFLFYIFLGHLARIFNCSLPIMYGLARVLSSTWMLFMLWDFLTRIFNGHTPDAQKSFWLLALGGGLGWLSAVIAGYLTGDFWVAETYPFLSMFASPHFALGLALILLGEKLSTRSFTWVNGFLLGGVSLLLGIVQPFGVVILGLWIAVRFLVFASYKKEGKFAIPLLLLLPGFLVLAWQYWLISTHPVLKLWNEQNITQALPVWDLILSLSPMLLWAALGGWKAIRHRDIPFIVITGWILGALILIYIPFNLQRRFMTALFIPVAVLGGYGINQWFRSNFRVIKWIWLGAFLTSFLTPLLVIVSTLGAIVQKDSSVYIYPDELRAFSWMEQNLPEKTVVLASPYTGLILPAWTGMRVVYGHPFETVNANESRNSVEEFFHGELTEEEKEIFFSQYGIEYIFIGPREKSLLHEEFTAFGDLVYQTGSVRIFRVVK